METPVRVKYIDINTGEVKRGDFYERDYTLNLTYLINDDGEMIAVGAWQLNTAAHS